MSVAQLRITTLEDLHLNYKKENSLSIDTTDKMSTETSLEVC